MNLEGVNKAGIWSLMHWGNKCVVLTCTSHRKNMACGTTCRWVKSSMTSEIQSYMNWHKVLTARRAYRDSAIYKLKKSAPQPLEAAHGAQRVAQQGLPCSVTVAWWPAGGGPKLQPLAGETSVSEKSGRQPQPSATEAAVSDSKLQAQVKFPREIFSFTLNRAILDRRPWHKENCSSNILKKIQEQQHVSNQSH